MPHIIPIKDLKDTGNISALCHKSDEPVFITKNGYGDMVIMSMETYEKHLSSNQIYETLLRSEQDFENGNAVDALEGIRSLRNKYGL